MMNSKTVYLREYAVYPFLVEKIDLQIDLFADDVRVQSTLHCRRLPGHADALLCLNGEQLDLEQVSVDGRRLDASEYRVDDHFLTILQFPEYGILTTVVHIKPALNTALMGLYASRGNFCTQCEAEGFRRITYFPDRPDVMTRFTTTITADKDRYPILLSNGNQIDHHLCADNRHSVCWDDPSLKPCYLFALVAGHFDLLQDTFVTCSGRTIDLRLYLEPGFMDQSRHAMESLKRAMRWDEEQYGREYDLSIYMIVAVSDFNMGAMENKGLNIFNTRYILAKFETATDDDFIAIEGVIAHEYFHNWTGNRITCRDWFQLTLKEGLTVFRDETFTEDMTSRGVARIDTVNGLRNAQFPEDASPLAHPIRPQQYITINNFYTSTVYRKGAEVIRMIRTLIGKENFRRGMDLYFARHDGQAVTTDDFVQAMADAAHYDFTQFKRWYDQAGTPELDISGHYNQEKKEYTLTVKQHCRATAEMEHKQPFHFPFSVALLDSQGRDIAARVLSITHVSEDFIFENVAEEPILSLLREFSAPVKLHYDYSDDALLKLFLLDSDGFSRYEAGQQYLKKLIYSQKSAERFVDACRTILSAHHDDLQYLARLFTLPSFAYLLEDHAGVDIDAVHAARLSLQQSIARGLEDFWLTYYEQNKVVPYVFSMQDVGRRAIKNLALYYLCATGRVKYYPWAYDQLLASDNMTDQMGALLALNHCSTPVRHQALDAFYTQWKDQPLVVNKWLMLEASAHLPTTLERVEKRRLHPAFDSLNPNNVYALIGSFGNNTPCFHEREGSGYAFVANMIIELDAHNPQVAARMVQPFTRWQQYDINRQYLMRAALEQIVRVRTISTDVYEIITKTLAVKM